MPWLKPPLNQWKNLYPHKRSWLITRSTFPGAGRHGGHWTGDNLSTWQELKNSIPAILENNIFGMPYTGADVCGFNENSSQDLCTTWTLLGTWVVRTCSDQFGTVPTGPTGPKIRMGREIVWLYRFLVCKSQSGSLDRFSRLIFRTTFIRDNVSVDEESQCEK